MILHMHITYSIVYYDRGLYYVDVYGWVVYVAIWVCVAWACTLMWIIVVDCIVLLLWCIECWFIVQCHICCCMGVYGAVGLIIWHVMLCGVCVCCGMCAVVLWCDVVVVC